MNTIKFFQFLTCILFLSLLMGTTNAQSLEQECGTQITPESKEYFDQTRTARQRHVVDEGRANIIIPVQHHVFHTDAGGGGLTDAEVQTIMDELNAAYAPANIEFVECDVPYHYNTSQFYTYTSVEENAMLDAYEVSGVLNFYYPRNVNTGSGGSICGYAYYPSGVKRRDLAVIKQSCARNGTSVIHEVGHYLSLRHTHNDGDELVDGSNCATAGDEICDTAADPNLSGKTDTSCNYTGSDTDDNGDAYVNPPTTNHMSYARKTCRTVLTKDQIARVAYSAEFDRDYLDCNGCIDYQLEGTFNYGEDFSSHDYSTSGQVLTTNSYDCYSGNPQLRVGNCNSGTGSVDVTFSVHTGTDKLKLLFKTGWSSGSAEVWIDGFKKGTITGNSSCAFQYLYLENISNLTLDGEVVIRVKDPASGCSGDINLDRLVVYSDKCNVRNYFAPIPYLTSFEDGLDNYWRTEKSNESVGRVRVTEDHGPIHLDKHLTMDVDATNVFSTNEAWLHLDMDGCSSATMWFYWKEIGDETHVEDGVFLSDDAGNTFTKIFNMSGGSFDTWNAEFLDLDALAAANGLSLNGTSVVKFQQRDNYSMTSDGIAIDFVYVYGCSTYDLDEEGQKRHEEIVASFQNFTPPPASILRSNNSEFDSEFTVFPNPASSFTQFEFTVLEDETNVSLAVYDLAGKKVAQLLQGEKMEGTYHADLDVSSLASGVYLAVLHQNGLVQTKKIIVSK